MAQFELLEESFKEHQEKEKRRLCGEFTALLKGEQEVVEEDEDCLNKVLSLLKKVFRFQELEENELVNKFNKNFLPGYENMKRSVEKKKLSELMKKIRRMLKGIQHQPQKQKKILQADLQFESFKDLIEKEAPREQEEQFSSFLMTKRSIYDGEDRQELEEIISEMKKVPRDHLTKQDNQKKLEKLT